ncbi:uncharacterized protein LOC143465530 isoform X2 [Clavelina lepadiformis]|uniref:uncharacterized protein LOC143465530 isoform X2 n=1 Tax=Clavelina lepadiformis TaxID=159417 RepID=UPI00404269D2
MMSSIFSFKRRRQQERKKDDEEKLDERQKEKRKKLGSRTLSWLVRKRRKTQESERTQQRNLRRVVSLPCVHDVTPCIARKFAYPSQSVGHLMLPETLLNINDDIQVDNYELPTKGIEKKEEKEKRENRKYNEIEIFHPKSAELSKQDRIQNSKQDSDVVIAAIQAVIGDAMTDRSIKIDVEKLQSSFSEEKQLTTSSKKCPRMSKQCRSISAAVVIGLLLIIIAVVIADGIVGFLFFTPTSDETKENNTLNDDRLWFTKPEKEKYNYGSISIQSGSEGEASNEGSNPAGSSSSSGGLESSIGNEKRHVQIFRNVRALVSLVNLSKGVDNSILFGEYAANSWKLFFTEMGFRNINYYFEATFQHSHEWIININATLSDDNIAALKWLGFLGRKHRFQRRIFEACFQRHINSYFRHVMDIVAGESYGLVQAHPEILPKRPTSDYILPGLEMCNRENIIDHAFVDLEYAQWPVMGKVRSSSIADYKKKVDPELVDQYYYNDKAYRDKRQERHFWKFGDFNDYKEGVYIGRLRPYA